MFKFTFTLLALLITLLSFSQACTPDGSSAVGLRPAASGISCAVQG